MKYRTKDDFQVKSFVPCPLCGKMTDEKDLQNRSKYIYGAGWTEHKGGCSPCFDKALAEAQAKADSVNSASKSTIFDYGEY
jgi:hypothetical protein